MRLSKKAVAEADRPRVAQKAKRAADIAWLEAVHERLEDAVCDPIDAGDDEEGLALLKATEERLDEMKAGGSWIHGW